MRTFKYRGFTSQGVLRRGHVEAEGRKPALRLLASQGVYAERLDPVRFHGELPASRRAVLYRELAALLGAGLPMERSLLLLMGPEGAPGPLSAVLAPVRDAVRDGQPIAEALALADPGMASYERAALKAAERTASLPSMLERIADFLEQRRETGDRLRSAAIYPCFVLLLGIGVAVLMLGVLVPRAQSALAEGGIALPASSLAVVHVARGIAWGAGALALAVVLLSGAVSRLCRRDVRWRNRVDGWRLRLPWAGRIARKLMAARFASTLAVLCRSGVPLVDGLALAGSATGNGWLEERIRAEAEQVRNGRSLGNAVASIEPLAGALSEWVRVGEAGGCLDTMLEAAARREQSDWERAMVRGLALFEPLVLVLVGLFVLAVALAVLLPVTTLTRSIG